MQEKIDFIKWITGLTPAKRNAAYTILIIISLSSVVYGFAKYIENSNERDRKECLDNFIRISNKYDALEKKLENTKEYHLKYVEEHSKRYEELYLKTQQLEKR